MYTGTLSHPLVPTGCRPSHASPFQWLQAFEQEAFTSSHLNSSLSSLTTTLQHLPRWLRWGLPGSCIQSLGGYPAGWGWAVSWAACFLSLTNDQQGTLQSPRVLKSPEEECVRTGAWQEGKWRGPGEGAGTCVLKMQGHLFQEWPCQRNRASDSRSQGLQDEARTQQGGGVAVQIGQG